MKIIVCNEMNLLKAYLTYKMTENNYIKRKEKRIGAKGSTKLLLVWQSRLLLGQAIHFISNGSNELLPV